MAGNHRSGRRPLPADKLARNQGRGREPVYDALTEPLDPPAWLGEAGAAEWARVLPQLIRERSITWADVPALEGYCAAYDCAVACEDQIHREGRTIDDPIKRRPIAHPLVPVARIAWRECRVFAAEFGLTPAARPKLAAKLPPSDAPTELELFTASRDSGPDSWGAA